MLSLTDIAADTSFWDHLVWGVPMWLFLIGLVAQGMFFGRFFIQWVVSEKARRSVVPMAFWYLSLVGGGVMFVYGLFREDVVILIGQTTGSVAYVRNIYFRRLEASAGD